LVVPFRESRRSGFEPGEIGEERTVSSKLSGSVWAPTFVVCSNMGCIVICHRSSQKGPPWSESAPFGSTKIPHLGGTVQSARDEVAIPELSFELLAGELDLAGVLRRPADPNSGSGPHTAGRENRRAGIGAKGAWARPTRHQATPKKPESGTACRHLKSIINACLQSRILPGTALKTSGFLEHHTIGVGQLEDS
jgi:hypothetical protein